MDAESKDKKYTPILPFDVTAGEHFDMYENPVYHRDITLFDHNEKMMNRGNTVSILNYKMVSPRKIGGDAKAEEAKEEQRKEDES